MKIRLKLSFNLLEKIKFLKKYVLNFETLKKRVLKNQQKWLKNSQKWAKIGQK